MFRRESKVGEDSEQTARHTQKQTSLLAVPHVEEAGGILGSNALFPPTPQTCRSRSCPVQSQEFYYL